MLAVGDRLGPYELLSPLGEGGMGEVWRARDPRLNRSVAIKVAKTAFSDRFDREARAIAALNHPHICTLHDVGPNYLVMELVEGRPLKGPLPVEKAVEYASQILDALDAAHRKGFTHRDLKPANILVTKQGIKLLDFGLVKQNAPLAETDATVTQKGQIVGTPRYMSPEQLQGNATDARSDLFAFGGVLYEMLSGKYAFEGSSSASVIAAILEREPAPLDLHPPLGRVINRCLAKDPDERFQTARDLKTALAWAMDRQPPKAAGPASWYWIGMAVAMVLAAFAGWVLRSPEAPAQAPVARFAVNPPEGAQFDSNSLAVSPDGRTLAFVATAQRKRGLWIRPLDGTESRAVPGTDGASFPFWSPDGGSIAYFAGNKLWRIHVTGGAPLAICDAHSGRGGAWSDDGFIVFASLGSGLRRVPAAGGTSAQLTTLDAQHGEISHFWPQVLPGGRLLYWIRSTEQEPGAYVLTLSQPQQRIRLVANSTQAVYAAGHLLWVRGSTLVAQRFNPGRLQLSGEPQPVVDPVVGVLGYGRMLLAASPGGILLYGPSTPSRWTWFDREGKGLGAIGEPGVYLNLRLSPDGKKAVVSKGSSAGTDLWMVEMERNVWNRFTFTAGLFNAPVWSPNGRTVVFRSRRPGRLFRKGESGAETELQTDQPGDIQRPSDWSRDSRWLLYEQLAPETQRDLWVLRVTPDGKPEVGAEPRPYLRSAFNEGFGRFSPEPHPRWIAYVSDESGRDEVYIQAFPDPRGKIRVSTEGGRYPEWGRGGRELFYLAPDDKLMVVGLKAGADSVEPSKPRELFAVAWDEILPGSPYDVAPNGQRFLVRATTDTGSQALQVIVNWPALLKK